MASLEATLAALKDGSRYLNWGREVIKRWALDFCLHTNSIRVLDVGCGQGSDLLNIHEALKEKNISSELYGIEVYEEYKNHAESLGIAVASINLEIEAFPYADEYFDVVVVNQVMEHVKEFFWIASEMNRVLKPGGLLIVGVPNLASWHNRLLLLLGRQPTSIRLLGPHVRGYTKQSLVQAMTEYGGFSFQASAGTNFYPFPTTIAKILAKLFPNGAVSLFLAFKKVRPSSFGKFLENHLETNFKAPKN